MVEQATPFDQVSLAVLAELFKVWWGTNIKPITTNHLSLIMIVARAMDTANSPAIEYTSGLPLEGDDSVNQPLPTSVTVAVKWTTELRGRSFRGRTYHVGLSEVQVNGNVLATAPHAAILAAYAELLEDLEGLNADLVIASRWSNHVQRTTGLTTPVTGVFLDPTVDSQRRRLPGRGL